MKTWHLEMLVVALVLSTVAFFSDRGWVEWVGVVAVLLTFAHVQVADRPAARGRWSSPSSA